MAYLSFVAQIVKIPPPECDAKSRRGNSKFDESRRVLAESNHHPRAAEENLLSQSAIKKRGKRGRKGAKKKEKEQGRESFALTPGHEKTKSIPREAGTISTAKDRETES
jgi:hypothetical protein